MKREHTKQLICDAILNEMKKKRIDHIKVSDIIQTVSINRSSFYYWFSNIDEAVKYIIDQFTSKLFTNLFPIQEANNHFELVFENSLKTNNDYNIIYENRFLIKKILNSDYAGFFENSLIQSFSRSFSRYRISFLDKDNNEYTLPKVERELYCNLNAYRVWAIIKTWADNDFEETPEEIKNIVFYLLSIRGFHRVSSADEWDGNENAQKWNIVLDKNN